MDPTLKVEAMAKLSTGMVVALSICIAVVFVVVLVIVLGVIMRAGRGDRKAAKKRRADLMARDRERQGYGGAGDGA